MRRQTILSVLCFLLLAVLTIAEAPAGGRLGPDAAHDIGSQVKPPAPRISFPDYPHILAFTVIPNIWLQGETGNLLFRWRVEPGPTGNPLATVAVSRTSGEGPDVHFSEARIVGEKIIAVASRPFLSEGMTVYTLTATDKRGARSEKTAVFEVKSMIQIRRDIVLVSLVTDPREIVEGTPFTFVLKLNNRSGVHVPSVNFPVRGQDLSLMSAAPAIDEEPPPPNQGELRNQILAPGHNEYRIRCSPGVPLGLADRYLFEIAPMYKNIRISGFFIRLEQSRTSGSRVYYVPKVFERRLD